MQVGRDAVVTAAHCLGLGPLESVPLAELRLLVGVLDSSSSSVEGEGGRGVQTASGYQLHPTADLALIRLARPLPTSLYRRGYLRNICLPKSSTTLGDNAAAQRYLKQHGPLLTAGWGRDREKPCVPSALPTFSVFQRQRRVAREASGGLVTTTDWKSCGWRCGRGVGWRAECCALGSWCLGTCARGTVGLR